MILSWLPVEPGSISVRALAVKIFDDPRCTVRARVNKALGKIRKMKGLYHAHNTKGPKQETHTYGIKKTFIDRAGRLMEGRRIPEKLPKSI